jgi:hypothetical protein
MAGYSATPLVRKLGIAPDQRVLVDGSTFELPWPPGVTVHRRAQRGTPYDVVLCFCPDRKRLVGRWPVLHPLTTPSGALWVMWPKRSSGVVTDLSETTIRDYALTHGRVDVKVCAVDDTWSALKHVVRVADR